MPELPEVETVVQHLKKEILNLKINKFRPLYLPIIENDKTFKNKIEGQTINDIKRIGKYLIFILDSYIMVGHLRMEGKFYLKNSANDISKHEHLVFELSNGMELRYHDTRKFGRFHIENKIDNLYALHSLRNVGTDALEIDDETLFKKIMSTNTNLKSFLLDQSKLSGIGNIYVNEILFLTKIHPNTRTVQISQKLSNEILFQTKKILKLAIEKGGTTISTFEAASGIHGLFQNELYVHGRKGKPCLVCGTTILKLKSAGRGTYYCPTCQKAKIVGITGSIASGKTTTTNYLKKLKYTVIDSDEIVKESYNDLNISNKILKLFNLDKIDKKTIFNMISNDLNLKAKLEEIIHPYVFNKITEIINKSEESIIFIDMPLLYEVGYEKFVDEVIVVNINKKNQLDRLIKREGISLNQAEKLISLQYDLEKKVKKANIIFDNNNSKKELYKQIDKYLRGE